MTLRSILKMGDSLAEALDVIEDFTNVDTSKAASALLAIRAVIAAVREGFAGKLSPDAVLARIELLRDRLHKNDAAALEALAKKFGTPTS